MIQTGSILAFRPWSLSLFTKNHVHTRMPLSSSLQCFDTVGWAAGRDPIWFDWNFAAAFVTTPPSSLAPVKSKMWHSGTGYPRSTWKMAVKMEKEKGRQHLPLHLHSVGVFDDRLLTSANTLLFSRPGLLRTKVYSAFHPSAVGKWVPAIAGKAKAGTAHSDCRWTCGCAGKTVKSLENTCHTWVLLQW